MGSSGKTCSWVLALLSISLVGLAVYLTEFQRKRIMGPIEDYFRFGKFTRDVSDLNYYLHGHILFSMSDKKEKIIKDFSKTKLLPRNVTNYYLEHIRNSVNHYEGEDILQRNTRLDEIISNNELENILLELFDKKKYNNITEDGILFLNAGSNKTLEIALEASKRSRKADQQALKQIINELEGNSKLFWVCLSLGLSLIAVLFFQCAFVPQTFALYKRRNKKSRKVTSRMSKQTLYIHLALHGVATLAFIIFTILFICNVTEFDSNSSTSSAFDFLKITKEYYAQMRFQQVEDFVYISTVSQDNTSQELKHYAEFLSAAKAIRNSESFSIAFPELKTDYLRYLFNIDCTEEIIVETSSSASMCQDKIVGNKHKLLLGQWSKASSAHQSSDYSEIFEEEMIQDHFQVQYCHSLLKKFQSEFEKYVSEQLEQSTQYLGQVAVTIGFLMIFWIPFFSDSNKNKKEAQRFEMTLCEVWIVLPVLIFSWRYGLNWFVFILSRISNIEPRTQKQRNYVITLKVMALIQLAISITLMFLDEITQGIYSLFGVLILWLAWSQMSQIACVTYILTSCFYSIIFFTSIIFKPAQNGIPFFGELGLQICLITFTVYFIAISYFTFLIYKEFKADKQERDSFGFASIPSVPVHDSGSETGSNRAIQGRGQAIGGASYTGAIPRNQYEFNRAYNQDLDQQGMYIRSSQQVPIQAPSPSQQLEQNPPLHNQIRNINQNDQIAQPISQQQQQNIPNADFERVLTSANNSKYFTGKGVRIG